MVGDLLNQRLQIYFLWCLEAKKFWDIKQEINVGWQTPEPKTSKTSSKVFVGHLEAKKFEGTKQDIYVGWRIPKPKTTKISPMAFGVHI